MVTRNSTLDSIKDDSNLDRDARRIKLDDITKREKALISDVLAAYNQALGTR